MKANVVHSSIILFDGKCNLCNGSVQFIIRHDKHQVFTFASLQSTFGVQTLLDAGLDPLVLHSIVLLQNGKLYMKSTAVLKIAKDLQFPWNLFHAFTIIPAFFRDGIYAFIAKNRFRWFGKTETCWIPNPKLIERFID